MQSAQTPTFESCPDCMGTGLKNYPFHDQEFLSFDSCGGSGSIQLSCDACRHSTQSPLDDGEEGPDLEDADTED